MDRKQNIEGTVRRYLLGGLSEPEQAAVESEYFSKKEIFEEVCALENDLIDDYVRGNLAAGEREQFERRYFSSPEKLRRVQFAGSMISSLYGSAEEVRTSPKRPESAFGFRRMFGAMPGRWRLTPAMALAGFAFILAAAVLMLLLESMRLRRALNASQQTIASQSQAEQELERQLSEQRAGADQLAKDLEALRSQLALEQGTPQEGSPSPIVAAFTLRPGLIRGTGEPQILRIAPGADLIELRLDLGHADFKKYSITLLTPEGVVVWKQMEVRIHMSQAGGRAVIRVPAKLLHVGDYILRVDGINPAGEAVEVSDFYFRVAKTAAH